ncbi:hypothetical protein RA27_18240 [Ruegeria sp. ANG-R]|uniref:DUF5983 family protein n=1 Tax=Ruegeria sp. ANG-R TaxID=1577903 RepID=UPI0005804CD5|nr:hypothetical protein [Ruegeria sp. ANG-R]KIC38834.1 hypothetical protein RA27_18240 [Ruegeria sp. ANG-R]
MEITFNRSTMGGQAEPTDGHLFLIYQEGQAYALVAHAIKGGYAISHLPSGRRVENCVASLQEPVSLDEAISGFRAQVDIGVTELNLIEDRAANFPVVNRDWKLQVERRATGVREFTELSTVHLRPKDLQAVANLIAGEEWESGFSGSTGLFVWRGYKTSEFCPDPLRIILEDLDTDYVMFDRDAPVHPRFRTFEDSWS